MQMMFRIVSDQNLSVFMQQLPMLGMRKTMYLTIMMSSVILLYMSIRLERTQLDTPAELLERRSGFIQWAALFILIMIILVFGTYGPAFDPAEFIYMQF
jgi:hypothetical protein